MKKSAGGGRRWSKRGGLKALVALNAAVRRMQRVEREKTGEVQLDEELEEEVEVFLKQMEEVAAADDTSIAVKRPALKRLAML